MRKGVEEGGKGRKEENTEVDQFQVELGEKLCGIKEDDSFILDRWEEEILENRDEYSNGFFGGLLY